MMVRGGPRRGRSPGVGQQNWRATPCDKGLLVYREYKPIRPISVSTAPKSTQALISEHAFVALVRKWVDRQPREPMSSSPPDTGLRG